MKPNVMLLDCDAEEIMQFAEKLTYQGNQFEIKTYIANLQRTGKWSEAKRYLTYFGVAFRYFLFRKKYNVIAGWQQFYALIFCFFCSVFGVKKTNTVIALNYTYKAKKGKLAPVYRWFMGKCMSEKYLDYLHVPSKEYAEQIYKEFGYPKERIIVSCFGVKDRYEELKDLPVPKGFAKEGYALAIGRSNRDFDFLIHAWKNIKYPLVIISDTYKGQVNDEHVTLLTNVSGADAEPWMANCGLMIIPIADGSICSGDTVLLTAMSLARKLVVTVPSTLAEMYIMDGINALLTPKEVEVFRATIEKALHDDTANHLGKQAREIYLQKYTLRCMGECVSAALAK